MGRAEKKADTAAMIKGAIEQCPSLETWKLLNSAEWELAVRFDQLVRNLPMWAGKPLAKRFRMVEKLVQTAMPRAKKSLPKRRRDLLRQVAQLKDDFPEFGEIASDIAGTLQLERFMESASQRQINAYLRKFG